MNTFFTKPSAHLRPAFTLVEILVVLAIIGVLAGLLLTNFVGVRERAADAKIKNDLRQLKTALRLYYNDFGAYPDDSSVFGGDTFAVSGTTYMSEIPSDFAYYSDGADEFLLEATLSNLSDEDIDASQSRCNPEGRGYFSGAMDEADYYVCED